MKQALQKRLADFEWWVVVVILFFSTFAFGGVHPPSLFLVRIFIILGTVLELALFFLKTDEIDDDRRLLSFPLFIFVVFLAFVSLQYFLGTRILHGSLLGTVNPHVTYQSLIQLIFYALFFFICFPLVSRRTSLERLASAVALLVFTITILGLVQRLDHGNRILWNGYLTTRAAFFGPFVNENHFGGFLGLSFPLVLGLMHYRFHKIKEESARELQPKAALWTVSISVLDRGVAFLFLLIIFTLAACFISLARLSSVVLLLNCAAYFALYGLNQRNRKFYFALIAILVGSFLFLRWVGRSTVLSHFNTQELMDFWSVRFHVAYQSLALLRDYPFFGTGFGTYGLISSRVVSHLINTFSWDHAHNDYVELITETGWVGFGLLMIAISALVLPAVRRQRKDPSSWSRIMSWQAVISIISIGIMEGFDFHLKIPSLALLFVFQLALLCRQNRSKGERHGHELRTGSAWSEDLSPARPSMKTSVRRRGILFGGLALCAYLLLFTVSDYRAYRLARVPENPVLHLRKAVRIQPFNPELWHRLAETYEGSIEGLQSGISEEMIPLRKEAISALSKATELSPTQAYLWHYLGRLRDSLGDHEEAITSLEQAVYWAPARLKYSLYLLSVYLRELDRLRPWEERAKLLEKARNLYEGLEHLESVPGDNDYRHWMGDFYYHRLQNLISYWQASG